MKFDKEKFNEKIGEIAHDAKNIALDIQEKCKNLVIYNVKNEKVEIKNIPQRTTSSGMIFY